MITNRRLRMQKRLLQFNNLPFSIGEIDSASYSLATKGASVPYTNNTHGSYYPTFGEPQKLQAATYRATFTIDFDGIACEDKLRYARFVKQQLLTPGKLWAVQGGTEIIWTNARITDYSEDIDSPYEKNKLHLSATFELVDGFWRLASRTKTFLCDYCPARFQDFNPNWCWDTSDVEGVCNEKGTTACLPCELALYQPPTFEGCDWKPLCFFSKYEDRVLKNGQKVPSLYSIMGVNCPSQYALKYDPDLEKDFFCFDAGWGRKFRLRADSNNNTTEITFCSRTDLPTDIVRIRLMGDFVNPTVTINGDKLSFPGLQSNGIITIGYGPKIQKTSSYRNPDDNPVDISAAGQRTNTPMFEIEPGMNKVTITGNTYHKDSFIYIDPVEITF